MGWTLIGETNENIFSSAMQLEANFHGVGTVYSSQLRFGARGKERDLRNGGVNLPSPEPGVRQIKFDAIPADIVEEVQISKTLQASMDGDGIGGSVNLVTKTATDVPSLSFSGMGGPRPETISTFSSSIT